ncbi:extradiol dioxygenase [Reichenbachiella carrageenanivorans]|uniref:Extradiol dioxygenase n=1 Tax=Reichenbachiella carrageenanivorans TaxID=2979869 RepID=A0ABY6CZ53_9BACT|nr:VOC family protein [Reichenbachiella carrageenanivorans]UXX78660.1 extradiol dioxygenase [Reichenbachiella carrageenanivorans]
MKQELWLNIPVKDLQQTKAFFIQLGFEALRDAPEMIGFRIGGVPVMMVTQAQFEKYALQTITDTTKSTEVLISVGAPDRTYVDEMALKVEAAGGKVFSPPADIQGWMYGCAFADLDGHRWNLLYMDDHNM